jgi:hypothetical protein
MSKRVHIAINPKTGQVEFEVEGVMGGACTDITQALVKGHLVQDERLTEDYYSPISEPAYVEDT